MHKDTQEALERLEKELLAQEENTVHTPTDEELDALLEEFLNEEEPAPEEPKYRNYSNGYGRAQAVTAYNTDNTDAKLDEYSDEVYEAPREKLTGLLVTAAVELLGIVAVLAYWAIKFL